MKIIVGLGNPGVRYESTRHNCGFFVLDEFAELLRKEGDEDLEWKEEKKFQSALLKVDYEGDKLLLVKPLTMMNLSGVAVSKLMSFYKEDLGNLLVIYDDIDLPLGKVRVRRKGSAGTHNGMRSVVEKLGSENFARMRIGIESRGELAPEDQQIVSFVLNSFTDKELKLLTKSIKEGIGELKEWIKAKKA